MTLFKFCSSLMCSWSFDRQAKYTYPYSKR